LPVATAPNSVIYGSGLVPIQRMAREGVILNLVAVVVIAVLCYWLLT
jgi:sodium-dependent dicarboxylate transporter 2/3/5